MEFMYHHFPNVFLLNEQRQTQQLKGGLFTPTIAFSGSFYQAYAGHFVKRKLIIIGSHVTVGASRERSMFGGVRQNVWD